MQDINTNTINSEESIQPVEEPIQPVEEPIQPDNLYQELTKKFENDIVQDLYKDGKVGFPENTKPTDFDNTIGLAEDLSNHP